MRLRNLKDKDILVENCDYLIKDGGLLKGKWQEEFGNNNAIHIEIGMGKGDYIYHMALKYPNINFIGIEKNEDVALFKREEIDYIDVAKRRLLLAWEQLDSDVRNI